MNETSNLSIAVSYYRAMIAKDFEKMATYLHEDVQLVAPFGTVRSKDVVLGAAAQGVAADDMHIRSQFEAGNEVMLAYDCTFPAPIGKQSGAVLMEFTDHLISKIELFFDPKPFAY